MSECKKPRYFVEKPQKGGSVLYYWQPGKGLTRLGLKTVTLSRDRAEAMRQADALNVMADRHRGGQIVIAKNQHGTLPWLVERYKKSPRWSKLRAGTKERTEYNLRRILEWSAERGDPPMRTFAKRDAEAYWNRVHHDEGKPAKAKHLISLCRLLWNYAEDLDEDIVAKNPFRGLDLPGLPPRDEVWQPEQIAAVCEMAIATPANPSPRAPRNLRGVHLNSIAVAVMIAANTAQRQGDILAMNVGQYDGKTITLTQSKTGITLTIPVTRELKKTLDEYLAGPVVAGGKVVALRPQADRPMLIDEVTGRRWEDDAFRKVFRKIATAAGIPNNMQFRDLRRTATVQLAEAGCEIPEIAAFGGWSIASVHQMLKVYCPLNLTMAKSGLVKLENYRAAGKLEG